MMITTIRGDMDDALLVRSVGVERQPGCVVRWEAWHALDDLAGDAVKRNVAVEITEGLDVIGKLGNLG